MCSIWDTFEAHLTFLQLTIWEALAEEEFFLSLLGAKLLTSDTKSSE